MTAPFFTKGHVYFGCEDYPARENAIVVRESSNNVIEIHLGFLQYLHRYSVTVEISKAFFKACDLQTVLRAAERSFPNVNCKVISITEDRENFLFEMEFFAEKERLMKEELKFDLRGIEITLQFNARVLGPGKGTPLLKNGIRCIGVSQDEQSDASDWHG